MKRSTKSLASPRAVHKATVYVVGHPKTIQLTLPIATPAEIRRSLGLSRTAKLRVERAIAKAGLGRKTG